MGNTAEAESKTNAETKTFDEPKTIADSQSNAEAEFLKTCDKLLLLYEMFKEREIPCHILDRLKEIERKIGSITAKESCSRNRRRNFRKHSESRQGKGNLKKGLSGSLSSVFSDVSDYLDGSDFAKFCSTVNCPYCSTVEDGRLSLIKHLDNMCEPFRKGDFIDDLNIPFSFFQILSNDSFKCNVCDVDLVDKISYFHHSISNSHKKNAHLLSLQKLTTDYIFCSCCQVLIANNSTEIDIHLDHSQHAKSVKARNSDKSLNSFYKRQKITCIYTSRKKFICFVCSLKLSNDLREFYRHSAKPGHLKNMKVLNCGEELFFCEFCKCLLKENQVSEHLRTADHKKKEITVKFFLCLFCKNQFFSLSELSNHMKSNCDEMKILRSFAKETNNLNMLDSQENKIVNSSKENLSLKLQISEKQKVSKRTENKGTRCLIVEWKGTAKDIIECFQREYGRISDIKTLEPNKFQVIFEDSNIIDQILLHKDFIYINNHKVILNEYSNLEINKYESDSENENQKINLSLLEKMAKELLNAPRIRVSHIMVRCIAKYDFAPKLIGFSSCGINLREELHFFASQEDFNTYSSFTKSTADADFLKVDPLLCEAVGDLEDFVQDCFFTSNQSYVVLTEFLSHVILKPHNKVFVQMAIVWLKYQLKLSKNTCYFWMSVIIFFLINHGFSVLHNNGIPIPSLMLQKIKEEYEMDKKLCFKNYNIQDPQKIFKIFLKFLHSFSFKNYVICLPFQCPIKRETLDIGFYKDFNISPESVLSDNIIIILANCKGNLWSSKEQKKYECVQKEAAKLIK